jgi:hypothetical protein
VNCSVDSRTDRATGSRRRSWRWIAAAGRACVWFVLACVWLWSCVALWLFRPLAEGWAHAAALLWIGVTVAAFARWPACQARLLVIGGILLIVPIWAMQRPARDRPWIPAQSRLPEITWDGERVVIENVRCATYRSEDDYDVVWNRRRYDLEQLESVDFVMVPFARSEAMAHVFVSFGFRDGEHLAISPEARREQGAAYSPLRGMFRHFPLMYVIGEESDLIGMRANIRQRPVYLYPVKASPDQVRRLFRSMLERAAELRGSPEFYQTFTNACSTNLLWHLNQVRESPVAWDWRVLLSGFSDEKAFELGLIDHQGSLEEARRPFCIQGSTRPWTSGPAWSRQIRAGRGVRARE